MKSVVFAKEIITHKALVLWYILCFCCRLMWRGITHDMSKLSKEERKSFIELAALSRQNKISYESPEYKEILNKYKPVIDVHYKNNSHHPEHHDEDHNNIDFSLMSIYDLVEMVCDWKAAGHRHKDASLEQSFKVNKDRFNMTHELIWILKRTFLNEGKR